MKGKWWICLLLSLVLLTLHGQCVQAEDTGSITVRSKIEDGSQKLLPRVELELFLVGSWENGGWQLRKELSGAEVDFDFIHSSVQNQTAKTLAALVDEKQLTGERFTTDADGSAVLTDRGIGVYLIVQRSQAVLNGVAYRCAPALFTLPVEINGEMVWDAMVEPKFEPDGTPSPTVTPTGSPTGSPTITPTKTPTKIPTNHPTRTPSRTPSTTNRPSTPRASSNFGTSDGGNSPIAALQRAVTGNVRTGDETELVLWALLVAISGILAAKAFSDRHGRHLH